MTKAAELAKMGEVLSNSQIGRKNIIINGGMQIAQRATSETGLGASSKYSTLDRYAVTVGNTDGRFTMSQSTVTDLEGFSTALKIDCTTADTSVATNEFLIIQQYVEGFNLQQLKATSTTTRAFTLSFYAKSNASRAIATEINFSNGTNKNASKLHTIGTSWARYTFTIPAASSTQIDNDNSLECSVNFWLHAGATYSSGTMSATLGAITNANRAVGIGSIFASTDNEIEITGIQLEVGSQATPFEHRSFGEELALCQRYYQQYGSASPNNTTLASGLWYGAAQILCTFDFIQTMRAAPTITVTSADFGHCSYSQGVASTNDTSVADVITNDKCRFNLVTASNGTAGHGAILLTQTDEFLFLDAEL